MTITKAPRELLPNAGIILTPRGGSRYSLRRADGANLVPPCVRWVQGQHVGDLLALQSSPEGVVLPVEAVGYYGAEGNLFLTAGPSGLLASARVGHVRTSLLPQWPAVTATPILVSYSVSLEFLVHSP